MGALCVNGVPATRIINGRQYSSKYVAFLRKSLLRFASKVFTEYQKCCFQQQNAPIHTSHYTRNLVSENGTSTLPCPSKSPNRNIIVKVWRAMDEILYGRGKNY